jgi:hypothetical protein
MLKSMLEGWVLDDTHQPHITTLQRYVRTADLPKVYEAVEKTLAETDMASLSYQAVKITHADWGFPGYGPAVLQMQVSPKVLDFQAKLVAAVAPYGAPCGDPGPGCHGEASGAWATPGSPGVAAQPSPDRPDVPLRNRWRMSECARSGSSSASPPFTCGPLPVRAPAPRR